jgi:hypothetical protein
MLEKLFAINLLDIRLDIKGWEFKEPSWRTVTEEEDKYPTLKSYNTKYKPSEVNDIFLSLEKYIIELVNDEDIKTLLIDNLTCDVNLDVVEGGNITKVPTIQVNDYIIFDKDTNTVVYYHGRHHSSMNYDYFINNGCRIIDTDNSFNFIDFKKICIGSSGNVLWGLYKTDSNRYSINKDVIPQINTRKGKIKMVLNGL